MIEYAILHGLINGSSQAQKRSSWAWSFKARLSQPRISEHFWVLSFEFCYFAMRFSVYCLALVIWNLGNDDVTWMAVKRLKKTISLGQNYFRIRKHVLQALTEQHHWPQRPFETILNKIWHMTRAITGWGNSFEKVNTIILSDLLFMSVFHSHKLRVKLWSGDLMTLGEINDCSW